MLRDTMISTMPVAMMAIEALWTDRFQRLRAVRKSPPDRTSKPIQMTASATTMPNRRTSISVDAHSPRHAEGERRRTNGCWCSDLSRHGATRAETRHAPIRRMARLPPL